MKHKATAGLWRFSGAGSQLKAVSAGKLKYPLFHVTSSDGVKGIVAKGKMLPASSPEDWVRVQGASDRKGASISFARRVQDCWDAIGESPLGDQLLHEGVASVIRLSPSKALGYGVYDLTKFRLSRHHWENSDFRDTHEHRVFRPVDAKDLEVSSVPVKVLDNYLSYSKQLASIKFNPLVQVGKRGGKFKKTKSGKRNYDV